MANLEALLWEVKTQVAERVEVDVEHLDEKIQEASRKDMNAHFGDILSLLGSSGRGGTLRETGMDSVLGHVKFNCRYYAPNAGAPVSRQDKRKRERGKEKAKRSFSSTTFIMPLNILTPFLAACLKREKR